MSHAIALEEGWRKIQGEGIDRLISMLDSGLDASVRAFPNKEFVPLYTLCYKMCTQRSPSNWSEQLYQRHGETFTKYLKSTVLPALKRQHGVHLLTELVRRWENHKIMNKWLFRIFMYLNKYYTKHNRLPPLQDAGKEAFKADVFNVINGDVTEAMLELIDREREGGDVDLSLLKKCVAVYVAMDHPSLSMYRKLFEARLLSATAEYYSRKAAGWIESDTTPEHLVKTEAALKAEARRVGAYLHESSEPRLMRVVENCLLKDFQATLLEKEGSGLRVMLRDNKKEDLGRLFWLFQRVEQGLVSVATIVREHIQEKGLGVVANRAATQGKKPTNNDPTFVKDLLALHDKSRATVNEEFNGNSLFQKALKDAFEVIINKDTEFKYSNTELIASFCDRLLKAGGEKLSDVETQEMLEKVVQLFSYIQDKDLFGEIYRNQLAKRLLNQRSASNDMEKAMITMLKIRCGGQYTGKMEGMLADLGVGADHQRGFRKWQEGSGKTTGAMDFSVQVLTTGFWPTYKAITMALPPNMIAAQALFTEYYETKTSHRKLQWIHHLGSATVRGMYTKSYDFQVTTMQAVTLLVFNDMKGEASFDEIRSLIECDVEVCKRLLHSLACGKYQVLSKMPPGRTISTSDRFAFNEKFSCPMRKVRVPMASLDESHNPQRVEEDRSISIEAAIVRTMKTRKTMTHQQLVSEVISQLHFFHPNPKVIKRRIEHLIEREYIERDDKPNTYRYLA